MNGAFHLVACASTERAERKCLGTVGNTGSLADGASLGSECTLVILRADVAVVAAFPLIRQEKTSTRWTAGIQGTRIAV